MTALENVMFPAELRGDRLARPKAETLLERVGLTGRSGNFPHQLSVERNSASPSAGHW